MIRVKLYRAKCNGCNYCVELAPAYWEMDQSDGKCNLLNSVEKKGVFEVFIPHGDEGLLKDCSGNCPTKAIKIE